MQWGTCKVCTPNPCKHTTSPLTAHHHPQPVNNNNTMKPQSTHPHCCKPLLAGWIVGANSHVTKVQQQENGDSNNHQHDTRITQHLPPHCEPLLTGGGGLWVLPTFSMAPWGRQWEGNDNNNDTMTRGMTSPMMEPAITHPAHSNNRPVVTRTTCNYRNQANTM